MGSDPQGPGASKRHEALSTAAGGACVGTAEGAAGPTGDLSRCPLSQAPSPLTAEPPACLGPGVLPWLPRVVGVFLSQKHKAAGGCAAHGKQRAIFTASSFPVPVASSQAKGRPSPPSSQHRAPGSRGPARSRPLTPDSALPGAHSAATTLQLGGGGGLRAGLRKGALRPGRGSEGTRARPGSPMAAVGISACLPPDIWLCQPTLACSEESPQTAQPLSPGRSKLGPPCTHPH